MGIEPRAFPSRMNPSGRSSILAEEGYRYDSSMYDRFQRSENGRGNNGIVQINTAAGRIWEISPSTLNVCGFQVPVAGGGYFRLFPYATSKTFLQRLEKQGAKLVMYLHPWEIDPEQPRMEGLGSHSFGTT